MTPILPWIPWRPSNLRDGRTVNSWGPDFTLDSLQTVLPRLTCRSELALLTLWSGRSERSKLALLTLRSRKSELALITLWSGRSLFTLDSLETV